MEAQTGDLRMAEIASRLTMQVLRCSGYPPPHRRAISETEVQAPTTSTRVNWGLRGCFPLDFRPLGWAASRASRALRELKMGGKWPGAAPWFSAHCLEGRFPVPIPHLEATAALYSRAKPAIFFEGRPCGARPGAWRRACGDTPPRGRPLAHPPGSSPHLHTVFCQQRNITSHCKIFWAKKRDFVAR
jgi:hypothetical protein